MCKTLYLSDLDGTLLNDKQTVSEKSCSIINTLVQQGMIFSYATARSVHTAKKAASGITATIPLIVYNGTFIIDNSTYKMIFSTTFSEDDSLRIYQILKAHFIQPIVYSLIDGIERFSYNTKGMNKELSDFIGTRKGDFRDRPLVSDDGIIDGRVFYFNCVNTYSRLYTVYSELKDRYNCILQKDIYLDAYMLEILPNNASKANASLRLKEILGCDRIVAFGDGLNDIPLAQISDEFYAVANANDKLKQIATGIIDSNNCDGVAKWLLENWSGK